MMNDGDDGDYIFLLSSPAAKQRYKDNTWAIWKM